jgi:hypothetical protein
MLSTRTWEYSTIVAVCSLHIEVAVFDWFGHVDAGAVWGTCSANATVAVIFLDREVSAGLLLYGFCLLIICD